MSKEKMEEVATYLSQHFQEDLALSELAQQFHYSPFHLSRTFKKYLGCTIKQYIEALRIGRGIREIMEEQQSVTATSLEAGYDSLGSFSNTFKRHTGVSPKKYQRESRLAYDFLTKQVAKQGVLLHQDANLSSQNELTVEVIYPPDYQPRLTCVGLFKARLPKEVPVVGAVLAGQRSFTFKNVPDGPYYLLACELLEDLRLTKNYVLEHNYRQASDEALFFEGNSRLSQQLLMRRPLPSDPPITVNLPVLARRSLVQQAQLRIRKFLP
ncbi:helix-turn-helix transcriptional regulator [Streptococcus oricebi]|uniref:AraC family transcriptional regulator n=1 Tax=Streptococcus oricebi TaxID=1547447 RepID=A0ABS5B1R4_9STRE|nr:AraC family transcriptional regulator [Streptococcus oricebi]MBP2622700.1 AraC family transcriptional regulator [Streptococcus oricebi]